MYLFEIIVASSILATFLGVVFWLIFVYKPKELPPIEIKFPETYTIQVLHKMEDTVPKRELSEDDKAFLKEREERQKKEMTENYLELSEVVNKALDATIEGRKINEK